MFLIKRSHWMQTPELLWKIQLKSFILDLAVMPGGNFKQLLKQMDNPNI